MSELIAPSVFALLDDERDLPLLRLGIGLGQLVAITAGPLPATGNDALLAAAAERGATRTVRIADPVLAGVDYLALAHVLACTVRHLCEARASAPVIVLSGDRGRGAVGPAVAERLAVPHLGAVVRIGFRDGRLLVDRACAAETRRFAGIPPVLLACLDGAEVDGESRPAPVRPAQERIDLDTLQIAASELEYRQRFVPVSGPGLHARPHVVANVEHLGERLQRDGLWPIPAATERGP